MFNNVSWCYRGIQILPLTMCHLPSYETMNSLNNISLVQHIWNACEGQAKYGKNVKLHLHVKTKKVSIRLELSILFAGPIQLVQNSGNINVNQQIKSFSCCHKKKLFG